METKIVHKYETIPPMRPSTRVINTFALAIALYAFACWVYVAAVALVLPNTLPWQLTHLARWPRTDTFGEISFLVSFVAFIAYRLTLTDGRHWSIPVAPSPDDGYGTSDIRNARRPDIGHPERE